MTFLTFKQAIAETDNNANRHLLLGNGFSIACKPDIFRYGKLFEQADFSGLSPMVKNAFAALKTQDFEKVIKALRDTKKIVEAYGVDQEFLNTLQKDADGLRELLVQTIAASHPAHPFDITDQEYAACKSFLARFKDVYTFNYDLLLYWTQMHNPEGVDPVFDDGFRKADDNYDAPYVVWDPNNSHKQTTWFLHGALHVFDSGTEIQKYTWINTQKRLIDQIREALAHDFFPLFVSEGTSKEKYEHIAHSDYLSKAYRSFSTIGGVLFIHGHSLAENDEHYLKRIEKGKITHLYVGLHGDPDSNSNRLITNRAERMIANRKGKIPLAVSYYETDSANVWGH